MDGATQGVVVMVATTCAMAFGDALVKSASADFSVWQIYVLRSLVAIPLIIGLLRFKAGPLLPRSLAWTAARSVLLMLMWIAFYASLPVLSLSVVAAAYYTGPLFITLFSAVLVGQRVGFRRWIAVVLGFAGVVVILRPGSDAFTWLTLLPVVAAAFYALAAIVTSTRCAGERPLALSLALNVAFLITGLLATLALSRWGPTAGEPASHAFLFGPWSAMGGRQWGLIVVMALVIVAVSTGVAKAYQSGPPPLIATIDYSYLVFAASWGFVFFAEIPDVATIGGMILIAGAGLLAVTAPPAARPSGRSHQLT